jgi:hypothetical protein
MFSQNGVNSTGNLQIRPTGENYHILRKIDKLTRKRSRKVKEEKRNYIEIFSGDLGCKTN